MKKNIKFPDNIGVISVDASVFDVISKADNHFGASVSGICQLTGKFDVNCIEVHPVGANKTYVINAILT